MISKTFTIKNNAGLHIRPTGYLVKITQVFESDIIVSFKNKDYNGKSVLGIIGAGIKKGDEITIICAGVDEQHAIQAIEEAIEQNLGEQCDQ